MTFPLTLIVIVLGLSPVDSDARTGPARPINRSNLECRPFLPRRLTQLRRIDLDHRSRAQTSRSPLERSNQAPTSLRHYPHSAPPPAASFNPASMRSHSRPVLRGRSPTRPHRTLKIPHAVRRRFSCALNRKPKYERGNRGIGNNKREYAWLEPTGRLHQPLYD